MIEPPWPQGPRYFAVPLLVALTEEAAGTLCAKSTVDRSDVPTLVHEMLAEAGVRVGDQLALLIGATVRALAGVEGVEGGRFEWSQRPVSVPAALVVIPDGQVAALDPAERDTIWRPARYWKIAPGQGAVAWPEWRDRGIAAIGWPQLGDLTDCTEAELRQRAREHYGAESRRDGAYQAWRFRELEPGDRLIANRGTSAILGVGTVTRGYRFRPGEHSVLGEDFPHQVDVDWVELPVDVDQPRWLRTLLQLEPEEVRRLFDRQSQVGPCKPQNIILYGPPGTGKTYSTARRALALILGPAASAALDEAEVVKKFRELQAQGQIELVTFHQAYGYEEFVEGIRPLLGHDAATDVRYELHDGAFKRIALRAAAAGLPVVEREASFEELWEMLISAIRREEGRVVKSITDVPYQLAVSSQGNIHAYRCERDDDGGIEHVNNTRLAASKNDAERLWERRGELGPDPTALSAQAMSNVLGSMRGHYPAQWIVHAQLLELESALRSGAREPGDDRARVQGALDAASGTSVFTFDAATPQYVLVIDEINRGNVSKILGELITLLEPDKRLDAPRELKLPLAYSPQHRFAVPPNLHVLGTMNTADRSIALMDVALRRRFRFEELLPNAAVIHEVLADEGVPETFMELVIEVFETLNERIRFLYDRDHQLGHAYFLTAKDPETLRLVFVDHVIPLLQEYFYGAWEKICMVLGCPYSDAGEPTRVGTHLVSSSPKRYRAPLVVARPFLEERTLGFDHDDYEDRVDYLVEPAFARGELEPEELLQCFLGVLTLDGSTHAERLESLLAAVGRA